MSDVTLCSTGCGCSSHPTTQVCLGRVCAHMCSRIVACLICNVAVSACGRGREWSRALDVLAVMARSSIQIYTITYNAAVSSCEVGGEWAHALDLLGNMARSSIAMDTITCNAAVQLYVEPHSNMYSQRKKDQEQKRTAWPLRRCVDKRHSIDSRRHHNMTGVTKEFSAALQEHAISTIPKHRGSAEKHRMSGTEVSSL